MTDFLLCCLLAPTASSGTMCIPETSCFIDMRRGVTYVLPRICTSRAQDNVVPLCRLADKYDIARLRHDCAWFLSANVSKLTLTEPLASPQNLLHAASLVERYLHQVPCSTQPVREQLDSVIGQLAPHSNHRSSEKVVILWYGKLPVSGLQLAQLAASAEYPDIVAPELQVCPWPGWVLAAHKLHDNLQISDPLLMRPCLMTSRS